jgi:sugar lactone lactonase YvrE
VDLTGNIYVAESKNNSIRKIGTAGTVATLAGSAQLEVNGQNAESNVDGTGRSARFSGPAAVATDAAGNVYVADSGNRTIRKVTSAAVVTTLAGQARLAGSEDGPGTSARFAYPEAVATDGKGSLYVTDGGNHTIRKITADGTNWVVTTLAGLARSPGSADGVGTDARFNDPCGIAVDGAGNIYVADQGNNIIRKVALVGTNWVVTTLAGMAGSYGSVDGTGSEARFNYPGGVAVDSAGNVYVADFGNCTIRKITPAGAVTTLAGLAGKSGTADGTGSDGRFSLPSSVAVDKSGNVYVADSGNHTIRKITAAGVVMTLAGSSGNAGAIDGTAVGR